MLIEGKLPEKYLIHANNIKEYFFKINGNKQSTSSKHYWIDEINQEDIKKSLDLLRNADEIKNEIQKAYPEHLIKSVPTSDEVYISVDPSLRKNSDIALSDCHYDAPFKYIPQYGNVFVRVILGLTKNSTTYTTIEDKKSLLSTLDFNGMDYNNDYHCVEGYIPKGEIRILLKLHFLCIHKNSPEFFFNFTEYINDWWTHFSREFMRLSAEPQNIVDTFLGYLVVFTRTIYNKSNVISSLIVILVIYYIVYNRYGITTSRRF